MSAPVCGGCGCKLDHQDSIDAGRCRDCRGLMPSGRSVDDALTQDFRHREAQLLEIIECQRKQIDDLKGCAMSEPVQKLDANKLRLGLLPFAGLEEVAEVFGYGAAKYRPNGWRTVDNAVERYRDALLRHVFAHLRGEEVDAESGLRHLAHAATNALLLLELEQRTGRVSR